MGRSEKQQCALNFATGLLVLGAVISLPSVAQKADLSVGANTSSKLEEVIVTAQRRNESSSDVGITMAAYSSEKIKGYGVNTSSDIAILTPGVTLSGTYGRQSVQFSIRGVTQSDFNDAIEAPVAVYVDDVYIASQQGQSVALFDIERVEVLKGPQGTLFGRNATGGLVHIVTSKPVIGEMGGSIEASYATFESEQIEAVLNVPFGDNFAMRASAFWSSNDSIWKNILPASPENISPGGEDIGDHETIAGRIQFLYEVSDDFDLRLTYSEAEQDLSESPWTSLGATVETDSQGRVVGSEFTPATVFGFTPPDIDDRKVSKDFALSDLNRFDTDSTTLHINKQFDDIELVSVTSYSNYEKNFMLDVDSSPVNFSAFGNSSDTETVAQEIRLSGGADQFFWTAGMYYLDITAENAHGILGPSNSIFAGLFGLGAQGVDPLAVFKLDTKSTSIFAQVSYDFTPEWRVVVGTRAIREEQDYDYLTAMYTNLNDYSVDVGSTIIALGPHPAFSDSRSENLWAGKLQLEYRPSENMFYYLGLNRGVKAGSYNGQYFDGTPALAASEIPYDPEELTSLEGGFKYTDPSEVYALNVSAFYYDYADYQSFLFSTLSGSVTNYDANSVGIEFDLTVNLGRGWRVLVTGAYIDAEVEDFIIAPGIVTDTEPTYTPDIAASFRLDYSSSDLVGRELNAGVSVNYQSEFFHNARNFNASVIPSRVVADFYANLMFNDGQYFIGAFVKNAFDERYADVGLDLSQACGCNLEAYGQPRIVGLKVGYNF
ncbi:MAG: TonB-dependent receptor [Arenicellales bacterium]|jgi:iron complex outermembrane receptor protein|nr:TonB-dependent receptor [Arenicellales bacterium]MDP7618314.1 TonB-dependent receptor [Arenicellales bacterium]|tara:strand:+ start:636 stop:2954 length:2319 start_codon:yes stop_codon:yes gene_type:complete